MTQSDKRLLCNTEAIVIIIIIVIII